MNCCPQCGNPLPLQNMKFCPECGCHLSAQPAKGYDVICPDCNSVITDENSACPNCGCPPKMFNKQAKTKFPRGEKLECPECGKVFEDTIPKECPNCGCPSERFKVHEDDVEITTTPENEQPKKVSIKPFLITLLFVIVGGLIIYYAGQPKEGRILGSTPLVENEEQAVEESASEDREEQEYDGDYDAEDEPASIEDVIYRRYGDYAVFKTDYEFNFKQIWAVFLRDKEMVIFAFSNDLQRNIQPDLCFDYEIRDNKLHLDNGYYRNYIGERKYYPGTSAKIYMDGDNVRFVEMKQYGKRRDVHISAYLTDEELPAEFFDYLIDRTR